MRWKVSFLHVLCHISAIFEDIHLKFCTHVHQPLPSNILYGFEEKKNEGKYFWKENKIVSSFFIWNFQYFESQR